MRVVLVGTLHVFSKKLQALNPVVWVGFSFNYISFHLGKKSVKEINLLSDGLL